MSKIYKIVIILGVIIIIVAAVIYWTQVKVSAKVYAQDTTLSGNQVLAAGEKIQIKNNATLTINGNFFVNGKIECQNGPLNLVVKKSLKVSGQLYCNRGDSVPSGDIGNGVSLVVNEGIEFTADSVLVTNGHVQIVNKKEDLAQTDETVAELFDDAAEDSGEGFRVGPFIPIELAPEQVTFAPINTHKSDTPVIVYHDNNESLIHKLSGLFIKTAHAQSPATDVSGAPVKDTVKIGGKWVVGNPNVKPPKNLKVPTPPKNIKKIILNFNFGPNGTMNLTNWTLTGPDGRKGESDTGKCDVQGKPGHDAMRLNARASKIVINDFTLNLGNGGEGGLAETSKDCDPGTAKGGEGGAAGNLKMRASGSIEIKGAFNINPGKGGQGGEAIAHGKTGKDGCPGKKGGDADARGGKGGDNKKGLKVKGAVSGIANVNIGPIYGGKGGPAIANGGLGGNGNACDCDGGLGGNAKATGGTGGDATSRTVDSYGGDGGDSTFNPGKGGNGFSCDPSGPGGDGGKGGDRQTAERVKGGTGKTAPGKNGKVLKEKGGDGGDGGDGCNEGQGGAGGRGNPDGDKGKPGKNNCVAVNVNTGVSLPNTNTATGLISFDPSLVSLDCTQSDTDTVVQRINLNVPSGHSWQVDSGSVPDGLQIDPSHGTFDTEIVALSLKCTHPIVIDTFGTQQRWTVEVNLYDQNNDFVSGDSFFDVFVEVDLPESGVTTPIDTVSIGPTSFNFVYNHANPICPLPIGNLNIQGPPGSYFNVGPMSGEQFPIWIDFPGGTPYDGGYQGFIDTPFPVEFPCLLDQYQNQTQDTTFDVTVYDGEGNLLGSDMVDVHGEFKGF